MRVIKRISGHKARVGGTQHSGWLPEGAAEPLPTPIRDVIFNLEIQFDGYGYLLYYASQEGDLHGDTWHETIEDAEQAAVEYFNVGADQWENGASEHGQ